MTAPTRMRVALLTGSWPPEPCGVGDYAHQLAQHLAGRDDVAIEAWVGTTWPGEERPGVRRVIDRSWGRTIANLRRALREFRPHLVHVQYPTKGYGDRRLPWLLPLFLRLTGTRIVATWHEYFNEWLPRALPSATVTDAVIVVRPNYPACLRATTRFALGGRPIHMVRNASAIPRVVHDESSRQERRQRAGCDGRRLVAYFGFAYPAKGAHRLFELIDPEHERLVLIGRLEAEDAYQRAILERCEEPRWRDAVHRVGWQPEAEVAAWLAAADAVVLPFPAGGGEWNSSLHAAVLQGTFVVTTAVERNGYDARTNVYYAAPDDLAEMRRALDRYAGVRLSAVPEGLTTWADIATDHLGIYREVLERTA
jgi:glycosyltransferase involved in cell wall biosynthesis